MCQWYGGIAFLLYQEATLMQAGTCCAHDNAIVIAALI